MTGARRLDWDAPAPADLLGHLAPEEEAAECPEESTPDPVR